MSNILHDDDTNDEYGDTRAMKYMPQKAELKVLRKRGITNYFIKIFCGYLPLLY